jgi:D,D-heptose 1,7-bisphosphate phosphatase
MQAVIIAGGKGTRLRSRIGDLPKPLAPVAGQPLLEHLVRLAASCGVEDILLLTGYRAETIREFCGDGGRWGVRIRYHQETEPLGTAGAVLDAFPMLDERFVVLYGDTMAAIDLDRFAAVHAGSGAAATLLVHPNDHPHDSDLVEAGGDGHILAFHPYPHPDGAWLPNLVNAAAYVLERRALDPYRSSFRRGDFAKDLFPLMLRDGARLHAYRSPEYIKDAGTPERLDRVEADYRSGRIGRGSLRKGFPAVFLDRDGTLTRGTGLVRTPGELELLDCSAPAVRRFNEAGILAVLATNQPVVARGECTEAGLRLIHNKLETLLGHGHAYLDAIYFCPHHPHAGYPGERADLKIVCECRKPGTGMIRQAAADLHIDLARSWLVGDSTMDTQAAANAGLRSVLVRTGNAGRDGKYAAAPDFTTEDVAEAAGLIIDSVAAKETAR